jgi:DNA-binding transcriptional MerR regulator
MNLPYFSTKEAAKIAGFKTGMMVDYLHRMGIVTPSSRPRPGRGKKRLYTLGDLVLLRAVRRLLDTGLSVSRLKKSIEVIRKKFKDMKAETAIEKYLVSDGKTVWLEDGAERLFDLTANGQMALFFDLQQTKSEVIKKAEALREAA